MFSQSSKFPDSKSLDVGCECSYLVQCSPRESRSSAASSRASLERRLSAAARVGRWNTHGSARDCWRIRTQPEPEPEPEPELPRPVVTSVMLAKGIVTAAGAAPAQYPKASVTAFTQQICPTFGPNRSTKSELCQIQKESVTIVPVTTSPISTEKKTNIEQKKGLLTLHEHPVTKDL
eukprot:COSAG04_NODE_2916_length_3388_cov_1.855275_4_plen_177_part_00